MKKNHLLNLTPLPTYVSSLRRTMILFRHYWIMDLIVGVVLQIVGVELFIRMKTIYGLPQPLKAMVIMSLKLHIAC